jgi:hypothetical protein
MTVKTKSCLEYLKDQEKRQCNEVDYHEYEWINEEWLSAQFFDERQSDYCSQNIDDTS